MKTLQDKFNEAVAKVDCRLDPDDPYAQCWEVTGITEASKAVTILHLQEMLIKLNTVLEASQLMTLVNVKMLTNEIEQQLKDLQS